MKWWGVTILIVVVLLVLGTIVYFFIGEGKPNLKDSINKKDPVTNKNSVDLIIASDVEGLERARVTKKENDLIVDFLVEASGLNDWDDIDNAWEQLQETGVTESQLLLFFNKVAELISNNDIDGLKKMGFTLEKALLIKENMENRGPIEPIVTLPEAIGEERAETYIICSGYLPEVSSSVCSLESGSYNIEIILSYSKDDFSDKINSIIFIFRGGTDYVRKDALVKTDTPYKYSFSIINSELPTLTSVDISIISPDGTVCSPVTKNLNCV